MVLCFISEARDVMALGEVCVMPDGMPPIGEIHRPKPKVGDMMYVRKGRNPFSSWHRAKIMNIFLKGTKILPSGTAACNLFEVKFESSEIVKQVSGKEMAYPTPSPVRLPVGIRCIANFIDSDKDENCYYAGIILEPMKSLNNFRYLVFLDEGYAEYVSHDQILLVSECSDEVFEDIHPDTKVFIRDYLASYPELHMVKMQQDQVVRTEWEGNWCVARVVKVDASLVKMHFDSFGGHTEWIYRGSRRLEAVALKPMRAVQLKGSGELPATTGTAGALELPPSNRSEIVTPGKWEPGTPSTSKKN